MSKRILLFFVCLLASLTAACTSTPPSANSSQQPTSSAQTKVDSQRVKLQAQELVDSMLNGNYERAADLTHPKLVEMIGGREKYIATLTRLRTEIDSGQSQISSITVADPRDIVEVNRQHYAIVPTVMRIKVPEGTLVGDAFMIGSSADGGQNWTFVDSGGRSINKDQLRTFFGPAADQLKIPEVKEPVLQK